MAHAPEEMARTKYGKRVIYHSETGQRIERWPVDARAMVECGEYTATPPDDAPPVDPPTPKDEGVVRTPGGGVPAATAEKRSRLMADWNDQQKIAPASYLGRWPDGPASDLAREIVELDETLSAPSTAPAVKPSTSADAKPAEPVKLPEAKG